MKHKLFKLFKVLAPVVAWATAWSMAMQGRPWLEICLASVLSYTVVQGMILDSERRMMASWREVPDEIVKAIKREGTQVIVTQEQDNCIH